MKKWFQQAWPHLVLIPVTCATLYPVLWVVKMALAPTQGFDASPNPIPTEVTTANFESILGSRGPTGLGSRSSPPPT